MRTCVPWCSTFSDTRARRTWLWATSSCPGLPCSSSRCGEKNRPMRSLASSTFCERTKGKVSSNCVCAAMVIVVMGGGIRKLNLNQIFQHHHMPTSSQYQTAGSALSNPFRYIPISCGSATSNKVQRGAVLHQFAYRIQIGSIGGFFHHRARHCLQRSSRLVMQDAVGHLQSLRSDGDLPLGQPVRRLVLNAL